MGVDTPQRSIILYSAATKGKSTSKVSQGIETHPQKEGAPVLGNFGFPLSRIAKDV